MLHIAASPFGCFLYTGPAAKSARAPFVDQGHVVDTSPGRSPRVTVRAGSRDRASKVEPAAWQFSSILSRRAVGGGCPRGVITLVPFLPIVVARTPTIPKPSHPVCYCS